MDYWPKYYTKMQHCTFWENVLQIPSLDATITLKDYDFHCYVPYEVCCPGWKMSSSLNFCATAQVYSTPADVCPWKETKCIAFDLLPIVLILPSIEDHPFWIIIGSQFDMHQ